MKQLLYVLLVTIFEVTYGSIYNNQISSRSQGPLNKIPSSSSIKCPTDSPNGKFPNPEDCHSFISCSSGQAYLIGCGSSLVYNAERHYCDSPSNYKCRESKIKCPTSYGNFPVPGDCHSFISCVNGQARLVECGQTLVFNAEKHYCDSPRNYHCDESEVI